MAYETGVVASISALVDAIRNFVKTNAALVGAGQEWAELSYSAGPKECIFQAPGLDGTEEIIVCLRPLSYIAEDAYALGWQIAQSYDAGQAFLFQPGKSAERYTPCSDSSMEYWLVASGRRLVGVVKISTVYTSFYLGKILPWGSTGDYPLPFLLGCNTLTANLRWSAEDWDLRAFTDPGNGSAQILKPGLIWEEVKNYQGLDGNPPGNCTVTLPYNSYIDGYYGGLGDAQSRILYRATRENIDGTYALIPIVLHSSGEDLEIFGELDGVYAVNGFDNFAENIVTISAVDHLVVPNIGRSGRADYFALKLA